MLKRYLIILIFFILVFPSFLNAAGIVPCGRSADDPATANINESLPCTLCHLIVGIKSLVDFGTRMLITVAAVGIFISGVMYVVSSGSDAAVTRAKEFLGASLKGFAIVLGAWFIVNITMWALSFNPETSIEKANWYTFTCVTTSTSLQAPSPITYPEDTLGYTYDSGIQAQLADASSELKNLLNCMQPKLPGEAKKISSISDGNGGVSCYKEHPQWKQCSGSLKTSCCWHTTNSCHYGGKTCQGKSYAVDFGNEKFAGQIQSAAADCGGKSKNEGDHVHVSIGDNCGCDEGL